MAEILDVLQLRARLTVDEIRTLVHRFYERVRQDHLLGPVFATRIAAERWPAHLDKMVRFWSTVLRGERGYTGN
ncbi:MAG TPA: group III truncated hemoglobin, partial [bacterium]|nr:group III truncated hemoglobin [bacterium]